MFRKLHSNRDTKDTLLSELRKEFGIYYAQGGDFVKRILKRYPRFLFGAMLLAMLFSICLAFTVFRNREPQKQKRVLAITRATANDGFGQILKTGLALTEIIKLKKQVDSLVAKPQLQKQDSVALEKALDRLHLLTNSFQKLK